MNKRSSYKQKLFLYFFIVFIAFTVVIGIFQYQREKQFKTSQIDNILDTYAELVENYIQSADIISSGQFRELDSLVDLFNRQDLRVTVIDFDGNVLYDNFVEDHRSMENHKGRPEIQKAIVNDTGSNIRTSSTTGEEYYYYARSYGDYFVRTAMVYDIQIREFLQPEKIFLIVIVLLFFIIWGSLVYVADKFGRSISRLSEFAIQVSKTGKQDTDIRFPNNEIGVIGKQIIEIFNNLQRTKDELQAQKDKLLHHMQISRQGIAFFNSGRELEMTNNHFIQYINIIADHPVVSMDTIFSIPSLKPLNDFIETHQKQADLAATEELPVTQVDIKSDAKYFSLVCIVFYDGSYEISITDETKLEKRKRIKYELTNNIARELQTPVNVIKDLLNNLIRDPRETPDAQRKIAGKALKQLKRLSKIAHDTSILTKLDETGSLYPIHEVNVTEVINDVIESRQSELVNKKIKVITDIGKETSIEGNKFLVYSIFQNLMENSVYYAGEGIEVEIKMYMEDDKFLYFSFADSGKGIPDEYQPKVFGRFFRIGTDEESYEGSGLGLAIVKNAVLFHRGEISVKNREKGGVEFLFSLSRKHS